MTACDAIRNTSILFEYPNYAISIQAGDVTKLFEEIVSNFKDTMTIRKRYEQIDSCVKKAAEDYALVDIEGYKTKPINEGSYQTAIEFLKMLPMTIPIPDACVDPDGMIEFEWYIKPREILTVTFEDSDTIIYAGLFGRNKTYGTEEFNNEIPKSFIVNIQRLFSL